MRNIYSFAFCCILLFAVLTGCSEKKAPAESYLPNQKQTNNHSITYQHAASINKTAIQVVPKPDNVPVLVNKQYKLPDNYSPDDLVYTKIPFIFTGNSEKRKMRREAAEAIEKLVEDAKKEKIQLLGVSAFRSHASQLRVFTNYVKKDGYKKARTYSAVPGTSEHETGLAIDVTGGNGKCAAEDCFGKTKESDWLRENAAKYGFILRYPKGKESITGYQYEPWHLRYVGKAIAKTIMSHGITLEDYYQAVPAGK